MVLVPSGRDKFLPYFADFGISSSGRAKLRYVGVRITSLTDKLSACAKGPLYPFAGPFSLVSQVTWDVSYILPATGSKVVAFPPLSGTFYGWFTESFAMSFHSPPYEQFP